MMLTHQPRSGKSRTHVTSTDAIGPLDITQADENLAAFCPKERINLRRFCIEMIGLPIKILKINADG